jgi:hypothetical protein
MDDDEISVQGAREAAERDEADDWVREFLASPGSDNSALGDQLDEAMRHWLGPVELPFDRLHRIVGPEGHPVLKAVDDDYWDERVDDLAAKIADGLEPPPLIVSFHNDDERDDQLVLEDGNHRVEALRRAGHERWWTVIGFESTELLERFARALEAES